MLKQLKYNINVKNYWLITRSYRQIININKWSTKLNKLNKINIIRYLIYHLLDFWNIF